MPSDTATHSPTLNIHTPTISGSGKFHDVTHQINVLLIIYSVQISRLSELPLNLTILTPVHWIIDAIFTIQVTMTNLFIIYLYILFLLLFCCCRESYRFDYHRDHWDEYYSQIYTDPSINQHSYEKCQDRIVENMKIFRSNRNLE